MHHHLIYRIKSLKPHASTHLIKRSETFHLIFWNPLDFQLQL